MCTQPKPKRSTRRPDKPKLYSGIITEEVLALERAGVITFSIPASEDLDEKVPPVDPDFIRRFLRKQSSTSPEPGAALASSEH